MTNVPQPVQFDWRPLREPVSKEAVRAWDRQWPRRKRTNITSFIVAGVVLFFFITIGSQVIGGVGGAIVSSAASGAGGLVFTGFFAVFALVFVGIAAIIVVVLVATFRKALGARTISYRINRFAEANAMTYVRDVPAPALPGMIFRQGHSRVATDLVRGERPRFIEFANYTYKTGSGKEERTYSWGYVAIKLDVPLPHIVLDATGNNTFLGSNLPISLRGNQKLSLEGDFDKYFKLYCPEGYERDALYLFTPDIMARFIDNAAELDIEIVDDWLFFYSKRPISTTEPAQWAWLFTTVRAMLDKFAQWSRWRDDQLASELAWQQGALGQAATQAASGLPVVPDAQASVVPPAGFLQQPIGVARQGRRLKSTGWTAATFVIVGFVLLFMFGQSGLFAGILGTIFGR